MSVIKRFDFRIGSCGLDLYADEDGEYIKFKEIQKFINESIKNIQTLDCLHTGAAIHNASISKIKNFFKEKTSAEVLQEINDLRIKAKKLGFKLTK